MASVGTHKQPAKARKEEAKKAIRASIDTYNQSPRKVRLVTDLVKGKKADEAIAELSFLSKRAAEPVKKLIQSAVANAKSRGENTDNLRIEDIRVDSAGMLVRFMPRAMGRAAPIRKRRSRIVVRLSTDSK
ncbi:MAG TPA: 50S ribosomal protein L22 [Candidatus Paceibacterota bacterium]|nr:50S ribosomal protein L22 [Candidatus Paceibacterota bacterium]